MSDQRCPVCDRPEGSDDYDKTVCRMWWAIRTRALSPSNGDVSDCWKLAKPWRDMAKKLEAELVDVRAQLSAARRSLDRHHAAQASKVGEFPDDARIE